MYTLWCQLGVFVGLRKVEAGVTLTPLPALGILFLLVGCPVQPPHESYCLVLLYVCVCVCVFYLFIFVGFCFYLFIFACLVSLGGLLFSEDVV